MNVFLVQIGDAIGKAPDNSRIHNGKVGCLLSSSNLPSLAVLCCRSMTLCLTLSLMRDHHQREHLNYRTTRPVGLIANGTKIKSFDMLIHFVADPYVAAEDFLSTNNLPAYYLDQVAEFIVQNAGNYGGPSSTVDTDPFTGLLGVFILMLYLA